MPTKASGSGSFEEVDAFDGGVGWIAHPEETMQRASHALVDGDSVWIIDPVDAVDLDDHLASYGTVEGVVVLFNYHRRDAATIAARHDVSVHMPAALTALGDDSVHVPVERFDGELADTGFHLRPVVTNRFWQEWALFDGETLVVPEAVGTAPYFLAPGERLGVSLFQRLRPPTDTLRGISPERVCCGHGASVFADAAGELHRALREARRTAPRMYLRHASYMVRAAYASTFR